MRLLSCDIENFLSIEQAHVDFDDSGLLLIEGWNYDVDRANGAGKTAVLNAISFALYDKLPRKITSTEILRRGCKKGKVSLRVDTGSGIYVVDRSRPRGVVYHKENNGVLEVLSITQEEFEQKLRLTYTQFIVSMYCSQANSIASPRFLLLNDTDKKQFLLQLLSLDEFTLCKKKCDEIVTLLQIKFEQFRQKMAEFQVKIEAYSESVVDADYIHMCISQKTNNLNTYKKALLDVQTVVKPDLAKYQKLEEDIQNKKSEFTRRRMKREMLFNQYNSLNKKLKPFVDISTCPTCGSDIDNHQAKQVHSDALEKASSEREDLLQTLNELDDFLLGENQISDLHTRLKERKRKESAEWERASISQAELSAQIRSCENEMGILIKKLNDNAQLVAKIDELNGRRDDLKHQMEETAKEIELQKTVASIYSPTGAQAYVLDSAVSLFNEQITKYIDMLWPNLTYELQSYKENVKGEVTAKFSESIVMDGKPISLGSLSGGELKALSICTDMALLGILEQQFGLHMSPVIFDEAFDGLDASGKEFALELIRGLSQDRQVIVIDHASEMRASFDKVLRVEKRNGISTLSMTT